MRNVYREIGPNLIKHDILYHPDLKIRKCPEGDVFGRKQVLSGQRSLGLTRVDLPLRSVSAVRASTSRYTARAVLAIRRVFCSKSPVHRRADVLTWATATTSVSRLEACICFVLIPIYFSFQVFRCRKFSHPSYQPSVRRIQTQMNRQHPATTKTF